MLGSVKTAVGRISPLAILGRKWRFCSCVPPHEDQFGGDFRARAERADADIAARKLLGDDAHRDLAEPQAAVFLGDRQAEDAHFGEAARSLRAGYSRWRGASPARAGRLPRRRSGASRSRMASKVSSRPGSPIAPSCASAISAASRARASSVLPVGDQRLDRVVAQRRDVFRRRGRNRSRRTISPWFIGMPPKICARYSPRPIRVSSSSVSPKRPSARIRRA